MDRDRPRTPQSDLYEDIARSAPTMLWVSNAAGTIVFQNEQYFRFTGTSEEEARYTDTWSGQVHPDDLSTVMATYVEALKHQLSFSVEYRLRRHDGEYREVLDTARPRFSKTGGFSGYIGSTFDITERKVHERAVIAATQASEKQSHELKMLHELKSDLQVCRELGETKIVLTKYCEQLFPDTSARILLHNNSRDLIEPFLSWGEEDTPNTAVFSPSDCWALRKGKSHLEVATSAGAMCPNAKSCNRDCYLCLPMVAFGDIVGILQLKSKKADSELDPIEKTQALIQLGTLATDEIATAIEEQRLRAKLQHQSNRDPLTHLFNRRYFMESLEREMYRAKTDNAELSLIMIDLDHFKTFNDIHGHIGGDKVLRSFGKMLNEESGDKDIVCRFGGEEFAVIALNSSSAEAVQHAERIRQATQSLAVNFHGELLEGITASIGVATHPDDADSMEQLISNADTALYAAKNNGRNQICEFSTLLGNVQPISAAS